MLTFLLICIIIALMKVAQSITDLKNVEEDSYEDVDAKIFKKIPLKQRIVEGFKEFHQDIKDMK